MTETLSIIYDGECPFCSHYIAMIRLRETYGIVELIDARSDHPLVHQIHSDGWDFNDGMALVQGETRYFGPDCMNRIALLSTGSGLFNRVNAAIFRSPGLAKLLYPMLKHGRNLTLRLMGRKRITL